MHSFSSPSKQTMDGCLSALRLSPRLFPLGRWTTLKRKACRSTLTQCLPAKNAIHLERRTELPSGTLRPAALPRKGRSPWQCRQARCASMGALHLCSQHGARLLVVHQLVYQSRYKMPFRTCIRTARISTHRPAGTLHVRAFAIRTRHGRQHAATPQRQRLPAASASPPVASGMAYAML